MRRLRMRSSLNRCQTRSLVCWKCWLRLSCMVCARMSRWFLRCCAIWIGVASIRIVPTMMRHCLNVFPHSTAWVCLICKHYCLRCFRMSIIIFSSAVLLFPRWIIRISQVRIALVSAILLWFVCATMNRMHWPRNASQCCITQHSERSLQIPSKPACSMRLHCQGKLASVASCLIMGSYMARNIVLPMSCDCARGRMSRFRRMWADISLTPTRILCRSSLNMRQASMAIVSWILEKLNGSAKTIVLCNLRNSNGCLMEPSIRRNGRIVILFPFLFDVRPRKRRNPTIMSVRQ